MQKRESFTINEQGLGIGKNELFVILVLQMFYDCEYHPCFLCVAMGWGGGKKYDWFTYQVGIIKCQVRSPHDMLPASHFTLCPIKFLTVSEMYHLVFIALSLPMLIPMPQLPSLLPPAPPLSDLFLLLKDLS